jgi:tetratricopeptide (TPR) repeat protein
LRLAISGDGESAIGFFDRGIQIRERLVNQENRRELAEDLAASYTNKANVLLSLGRMAEVVSADDRAIKIYESLLRENGSKEFSKKLASACMHKALALSCARKYREAVVVFDLVIEIREGLMKIDGERDLVGDIASAKGHRAIALFNLGQRTTGLREAREALAVLRAEVARTGRTDLQSLLKWLPNVLSEVDSALPETSD